MMLPLLCLILFNFVVLLCSRSCESPFLYGAGTYCIHYFHFLLHTVCCFHLRLSFNSSPCKRISSYFSCTCCDYETSLLSVIYKIVLISLTSGSIFQNINDLYFRQRSFKTKMLIILRFLSSRLRRVTSRSRVKYGFAGDSVLHKSPSGPGSPAPGGNTRRQGNRASQGLHSSLASVSRGYSIRIWGH